MALVKDHLRRLQASSYGEEFSAPYGLEEFHKIAMEDKTLNCFDWMVPDGAAINALFSKHSIPPSYSHQLEHHQKSSKLSHNGGYEGTLQPCGGSFLNFADKANDATWNPNFCSDNYKWKDDLSHNSSSDMAANWVFPDSTGVLHSVAEEEMYHEMGAPKRSHKRDNPQSIKKQRNEMNASKKTKTVADSCSKDPQSMAAKQRRERISERLKILQELVPNGSKVDLVTMLEKAISYVKFLQLQVKVLATDEFWPAQGGKAPDISQVKDAIDAILVSQRSVNACSSSKLPLRQQ